MKTRHLACSLLALLAVIALYFFISYNRQVHFIRQAHSGEIRKVQMITGALLETHPDLAGEIAVILRENDPAARETGAAALARYGYDEGLQLWENDYYKDLLASSVKEDCLFVCLFAALAVVGAAILYRRHQNQIHAIEQVLEQYLKGEFASSDSTAIKGKTNTVGGLNRLSDTLLQLGGQLRLFSLRLEDEQKRTKTLVTDISHQIKTPIASLRTCLELYMEASDPGEREEFGRRCLLQMDKLEALTGVMMNISRLETEVISINSEKCDLRELLLQSVNAAYGNARKNQVEFVVEPFKDVEVLADPKWTVEAIVNILDNAIKYSPAGTDIQIKVECFLNYARLYIADEGIGIPREERAQVFQRFYRGSHPLVRTSEGSGVGLYLARFILEAQGGSVWVSGSGQKGTTFAVQCCLFPAVRQL